MRITKVHTTFSNHARDKTQQPGQPGVPIEKGRFGAVFHPQEVKANVQLKLLDAELSSPTNPPRVTPHSVTKWTSDTLGRKMAGLLFNDSPDDIPVAFSTRLLGKDFQVTRSTHFPAGVSYELVNKANRKERMVLTHIGGLRKENRFEVFDPDDAEQQEGLLSYPSNQPPKAYESVHGKHWELFDKVFDAFDRMVTCATHKHHYSAIPANQKAQPSGG